MVRDIRRSAFLTILGAVIVAATIVDLYLAHKARGKDTVGVLTRYLLAFSAAANTDLIMRTTNNSSDAYALRFLHGLRFLSLVWIMLGHSYGTISDTLSGMGNNIAYFERWENMILTGGYLSVDTFFFLRMLVDTLESYYVMPFYHAVAYFSGCWLDAFLSWRPFTTLSRLSFGVYLVHSPFFLLTFHISRERIYFSHFFIGFSVLIQNCSTTAQVTLFFSALVWCFSLSYLLFIACEAPVGRIDKLLFSPRSPKPDVPEIADLNAWNGAQRDRVAPQKAADVVCCDSGAVPGEALEKNKVFIIINGDTVCCHL
ncbi:hypothetical protein HPB50_008532 [Hyalomma asiaticum]|uniref:Uncharacterized protein n=1 Tax=Hyalomma asiaticum TaxID=266040 RepID=A0ACB7TH69_HYAAI|nr:hypothetical protein HPB50_008532 [Hyalomma asiaticum]